jgi:hypothetical protein
MLVAKYLSTTPYYRMIVRSDLRECVKATRV